MFFFQLSSTVFYLWQSRSYVGLNFFVTEYFNTRFAHILFTYMWKHYSEYLPKGKRISCKGILQSRQFSAYTYSFGVTYKLLSKCASEGVDTWYIHNRVHLVLQPHGIKSNFLKLDLCLPGAGFIPIISTKGIN